MSCGEISFISNDVQLSTSKMLTIIDRKILTVEKCKEKERKITKKYQNNLHYSKHLLTGSLNIAH